MPNFDYKLQKEYIKSCEQELPELILFLKSYWENRTRFTMLEISQALGHCLSEYYGRPYIIRCKYILTENPFIQIIDGQKRFHLSLEYYGVPADECFAFPEHILPNHIVWNKRFYRYEQDFNHNVTLIPMDSSEIRFKKQADQRFELLQENGQIIWIGTKERDVDTEELEQEQTWREENIPIEERNINRDEMILNTIIQYIENRENNTLSPSLSEEETNSILNDFFQKRKQK